MFVSYVYNYAGVPLIRNGKGSPLSTDWKRGVVFTVGSPKMFSYRPSSLRPGDVVYRPRNGGFGHVGIVEKVDGGRVWVIEGNGPSDTVRRNSYTTSNAWTAVTRAPGL
jgi:surface antigen